MRKDIMPHCTAVFILSTPTKKNLIVQGRKTVKFVIVVGIEKSVIFIKLNKIKILLKTLLKQFTNKILYVIIKL